MSAALAPVTPVPIGRAAIEAAPVAVAGTALLELRGVGRAYPGEAGEVVALADVDLAIRAGEFVAIVGPSGSGKSTLMNLLGCLDRPTSGAYRVAGHDVATLDDAAIAALRRDTFGFIFQRYHLMADLSALENVAMPAVYAGASGAARRARAEALLARFGLADRAGHRPGALSGGQQQRVSIARALMNGGKVILADEPTGALDSASGREVLEVLHQLHAAGHTIILITHDNAVATHADRRIAIADGRIVEDVRLPPSRRAASRIPGAPAAAPGQAAGGATLRVIGASLRMALASLVHNKLRTALTTLGIVIGVASVVAMLAIGAGAKAQVLAKIQAMGTDLLSVKRGLAGVRGSGSGVVTLTPEDLGPIRAIPGVTYAIPETDRATLVRWNDRDLVVPAIGTDAAFPRVRNWPIARGAFFTPEDVARYSQVAVMGHSAAVELFGAGENPLGRIVLIGNAPFRVVGVMARKGASSGGTDLDYQVWVPYTTAATRIFGQRWFRDVTVKVASDASLARVERQVRSLLIHRHGQEDFHIRNMADVIETATDAQDTLTALLAAIAVIALAVGGIGVMNIMLVAVTERTREIGIRRAIGARSGDVLVQFLAEAVVVCVAGGLVGVILGVAAALVVADLTGWLAVFTAAPIVLAFACAASTGVIFGLLPARKAARLDPVQALARE